jgi:hypothetical protein
MSVFTGPLSYAIRACAIRACADHAVRACADHAVRACADHAVRASAIRVLRVLDCAIDGAPATLIAQSRLCGEAAR